MKYNKEKVDEIALALLEIPECSDLWSEMNGKGVWGLGPHLKNFRLQKPRPVVGVIHYISPVLKTGMPPEHGKGWIGMS